MKIEQIYTHCLAQAAYYIESNGEAAIIDPLRDVDAYIERAEKDNARIKYIFETHFHADFVSGHVELARKTGALIVFGPTAQPGFAAHKAADRELFTIGNCIVQLLHTPGHTMESSCFLVFDENKKATALFSGDTLFIGDVGRPDLAQKINPDLTAEKLAKLLYHSLRDKIMPLDDSITVYPAHGAGSACGKNLSTKTTDTLGHQKLTNYALQPGLHEQSFVETVLTGQPAVPAYFPSNVLLNIRGYDTADKVMQKSLQPLSANRFEEIARQPDTLILDTRSPDNFCDAHIPGSVNIGLEGQFAPWAGALIEQSTRQIVLVCDEGKELEVVTRLSRVGFDMVAGFLENGTKAWKAAGKTLARTIHISPSLLLRVSRNHPVNLIDVRRPSEFNAQHAEGAINIPLGSFDSMSDLPDKTDIQYVYCEGGYRSVIFISLLERMGYNNLINITGGIKAMKSVEGFRLTKHVCPANGLGCK